MAKDPAFLFYSQDFLVGTMVMSFEERGKYITILCYMHQHGHVSEETIRLLVGSISDTLRLKFKQDSGGLFYNERMEIEVEKRQLFIESRKQNGKKGGRKPKDQTVTPENPPAEINNLPETTSLTLANLIENENENEINEDANQKIKGVDELKNPQSPKLVVGQEEAYAVLMQTEAARLMLQKYKLRTLEHKFEDFYKGKVSFGEFNGKTPLDIARHFCQWLPFNLSIEAKLQPKQSSVSPSASPAN